MGTGLFSPPGCARTRCAQPFLGDFEVHRDYESLDQLSAHAIAETGCSMIDLNTANS